MGFKFNIKKKEKRWAKKMVKNTLVAFSCVFVHFWTLHKNKIKKIVFGNTKMHKEMLI